MLIDLYLDEFILDFIQNLFGQRRSKAAADLGRLFVEPKGDSAVFLQMLRPRGGQATGPEKHGKKLFEDFEEDFFRDSVLQTGLKTGPKTGP